MKNSRVCDFSDSENDSNDPRGPGFEHNHHSSESASSECRADLGYVREEESVTDGPQGPGFKSRCLGEGNVSWEARSSMIAHSSSALISQVSPYARVRDSDSLYYRSSEYFDAQNNQELPSFSGGSHYPRNYRREDRPERLHQPRDYPRDHGRERANHPQDYQRNHIDHMRERYYLEFGVPSPHADHPPMDRPYHPMYQPRRPVPYHLVERENHQTYSPRSSERRYYADERYNHRPNSPALSHPDLRVVERNYYDDYEPSFREYSPEYSPRYHDPYRIPRRHSFEHMREIPSEHSSPHYADDVREYLPRYQEPRRPVADPRYSVNQRLREEIPPFRDERLHRVHESEEDREPRAPISDSRYLVNQRLREDIPRSQEERVRPRKVEERSHMPAKYIEPCLREPVSDPRFNQRLREEIPQLRKERSHPSSEEEYSYMTPKHEPRPVTALRISTEGSAEVWKEPRRGSVEVWKEPRRGSVEVWREPPRGSVEVWKKPPRQSPTRICTKGSEEASNMESEPEEKLSEVKKFNLGVENLTKKLKYEKPVKVRRIVTRLPPQNRIREKPPKPDPLACKREPYSFLEAAPVEVGIPKSNRRKPNIHQLRKNPGFKPNNSADKARPDMKNRRFRPIFHPRLGHMIEWSHPDYFKLAKKRRRISPSVGLVMPSCAVYARGEISSRNGKHNLLGKVDEKEPIRDCLKKKTISELARVAPKFLNQTALEYLRTNWEPDEKSGLPDNLIPLTSKDGFQKTLVTLKLLIQLWKVGPETNLGDMWVNRALLCFSGDELKGAISIKRDWGGLTDLLRATVASCKQEIVSGYNHELWTEHNVVEIAAKLASDTRLAPKLAVLDDALTYDDASDDVKLQLLRAVDCRIEQKKSWWEKDEHIAYIFFRWPEGDNMGYYHVSFNITTGDTLHKCQYHFKRGKYADLGNSKARLIYGGEEFGDKYKEERSILQAASKGLSGLRLQVLAVLKSSKLKKVATTVIKFWRADMGLLVFLALKRLRE